MSSSRSQSQINTVSTVGGILVKNFSTLLPVIYTEEKVTCTQHKYKNLYTLDNYQVFIEKPTDLTRG